MTFCLPSGAKEKFTQALREKRISTEALVDMSSEHRSLILEEFFGADKVKEVNTLFEEKLILKSIQTGLKNWERQVSNKAKLTAEEKAKIGKQINNLVAKIESGNLTKIQLKDATNKLGSLKAKYAEMPAERAKYISHDVLSRIERMEKVLDAQSMDTFLRDAAEKKLGFSTTFSEAQIIMKATDSIKQLYTKMEGTKAGSPERMKYGEAVYELDKFVNEVREGGKPTMTLKEWGASPAKMLEDVAGTEKAFMSSWDFSFGLRQGLKLMAKSPSEWGKVFFNSGKDAIGSLKGKDGQRRVHAEMYSDPNFLNGKWHAAKLDVGLAFEEAYPSTVLRGLGKSSLSPVRGLGRVYDAAETGFTASALRTRMVLMNMYIKHAERMGIDMTVAENAVPWGKLANSLSGRGHLGSLEHAGDFLNLTMFSARFLKSNLDVFTAPLKYEFGRQIQNRAGTITKSELLARREAAMNTYRLFGGIAAIMMIADAIAPGSVQFDPRSTDFGKIKIGDTRFDVTGGLGSIAVLTSRLVPTEHNGTWGWWRVNTKGQYKLVAKLSEPDKLELFRISQESFGTSALEALGGFLTNKTAPLLNSLFLTPLRGQNFDGTDVTGLSIIENLAIPLPLKTFKDLDNPEAAPMIIRLLAEMLGIGTSTY